LRKEHNTNNQQSIKLESIMARPTSFSRSRRLVWGGQRAAKKEKARAKQKRRRLERAELARVYNSLFDEDGERDFFIGRIRPDAWNVC
jgi:hypothetical protein